MGLNDWNSYENAADRGPISFFAKILGLFLVIIISTGIVGYGLGWFSEAATVTQQEFGPKAALIKYEWFKEQAAAIKKMDQDVVMFEKRVKSVEDQYAAYGKPASWSPDVRFQYNRDKAQTRDDLIAVSSQRNNLVKEYNAASSKFNWSPFQTDPNRPNENFQEYVVK